MPTNQLALLRLVTNVVASASVWKVVNEIIRNNVVVETTADAVKVWTGSLIIGSMITDQASTHVNHHFDRAVTWWEEYKDKTPAK
jgi:hypothetical protein